MGSIAAKKKKTILLTTVSACSMMVIGLVVSGVSQAGVSFIRSDYTSEFSITLNSDNKVTSNGDKVQKTALDNDVTFTYSGVSGSTSGHVTLASNGYLVNKDGIRSMEGLTCSYSGSGTLKFKLSYDGETWGGETTVTSGYKFELGSNPYFVQFTAYSSSVTIESIKIEYSCVETIDEHRHEVTIEGGSYYQKVSSASSVSGDYLIVYEASSTEAYVFNGALDSLDAYRNYVVGTIDADGHITSTDAIDGATFNFDGGYILSSSGYYIYSNEEKNQLKTTNDKTVAVASTISVSEGELTVQTAYTSLRYNKTATSGERFRFYKSGQQAIALYEKVTVPGETYWEYDTPTSETYITGFVASDSKANSYKVTDSYDSANGLVVNAVDTNGQYHPLAKGGDDGYSYVVKNSLGEVIDSSKAFGGEDDATYTVTVSYKEYIPVVINISVEYAVSLTSIEVHSETLTFNTANKLSDYTSGITADLKYNKSTSDKTVSYANFEDNDVELILIDPNGVTKSISDAFAISGTWKIKIRCISNPSVYGELDITVNAIPVTNITINSSSTSIEEGKTLQLEVSVAPNDATNKEVEWTSSASGVATVSGTGLVTAISVGKTTIKATAKDGSNVYGQIEITVTEKTVSPSVGTYSLLQGSLEVGNYVIFASSSSEGSAKAMGAQSGKYRIAEDVTISSAQQIVREETSAYRGYLVKEGTTSGTYAFYDETSEKYLCATSSSSNDMGEEATLSANSSWSVEGSTIIAQGNYTRNQLRYNGSTPRFSCYGSNTTMTKPTLFVKEGQAIYPTKLTLTGSSTISVGEASEFTVGFEPTNTTYKTVTWSSSNDAIATVSNNGIVTGVKEGTVTITVTGYNGTSNITASKEVTINKVYVSGVSITEGSSTIYTGDTTQLVAVVSPTNAYDKNVTWVSSDPAVASVNSNGLVSGVSQGSATITVTTVGTDSSGNTKSATFNITVNKKSVSDIVDTISHDDTVGEIATGSSWKEFTVTKNVSYYIRSMGLSGGSHALQWNANGYLYNTDTCEDIKSITINSNSGKTFYIFLSNSKISDAQSTSDADGTITSGGTYTVSGSYKYLRIQGGSSSTQVTSISITYSAPTPIDPESINFTSTSGEVGIGQSKSLSVNYVPSNANQNKELTWTSSNTNIATVDENGKVSVIDNSSNVGKTVTITAKLTNLPSVPAITYTITVTEPKVDDYTIMLYMCGSDLESGAKYDKNGNLIGYYEERGRAMSDNIDEVLSIAGQERYADVDTSQIGDNINIIIETGGAKRWYGGYPGMDQTKVQRWRVENQSMVLDSTVGDASNNRMCTSETFQSFIEWGLEYYPAKKTAVIISDHGNGMQGVCSDEYSSVWDMLTGNETVDALTNAYKNSGIQGQKLEWIGYDACLMAMQDVASFNMDFFNYQISSQESEPAGGWDFDGWIPTLLNDPSVSMLNLGKSICDTYHDKVDATYKEYAEEGSEYSWYADFNDACLSLMDLSKMQSYIDAWETMTMTINASNASVFSKLVGYAKECYAFANSDDDAYEGGPGTSSVDAYDAYTFLGKIKSGISGSGAGNVQTLLNQVVIYKKIGKSYLNHAYGISVFVATYGQTYPDDEYTTKDTKFTNWRLANIANGVWYDPNQE